MSPKPRTSKRSSATTDSRKHFVLDTNVLLHDPSSLFQFEEHDVYIPLVVLEELDRHKKGVADIARNARQVTRSLDELLRHGSMTEGFELRACSNGRAAGRLYIRQASDLSHEETRTLGDSADNQILAFTMSLLKEGHDAYLVTKDINLRVKALSCDVPAQDYRNDRVLSDEDVLPRGYLEADERFWEKLGNSVSYGRRAGRQTARIPLRLPLNSYLVDKSARGKDRIWRVDEATADGSVLIVVPMRAQAEGRPMLYARNTEQIMALDMLHDETLDAVSLLGPAGTGKTLLAVASGLEQVRDGKFSDVLITRATVPLGEEIGFLPGTEEDKMGAWLGGTLRDVFSVLQLEEGKGSLREKVEIASMSFMRGRSFQGKYIVIDEAQNLTSRQTRALLTRAGEGTKVVLTGNTAQIDTPYLDEGSSGLVWAVKALQDWAHAGHLILNRGERSRLATYVEDVAERAS